jgi:hypothetical protein
MISRTLINPRRKQVPQPFVTPNQALSNANDYGEGLIQRANEGDRATALEVDAIMRNPAHPYYSAVNSRLCRFMCTAFGWVGEPR